MTSRFNFTKVLKPRCGGKMRLHPTLRDDSIRLTNKNLTVGKSIMSRFVFKGKSLISIEKDVNSNALRVVLANSKQPTNETYSPAATNTRLFTNRPRGLYDMPNGNYVADLKEPNVFVLEG